MQYNVQCKLCGYQTVLRLSDIKNSKQCRHLTYNGQYKKTSYYRRSNMRLYQIFKSMQQRCYVENNKDYKQYGGKGITICDEWLTDPSEFENWALNHGYTDSLTIDRINPQGNYCPQNCRWVSVETNSKYKSTTRILAVDDISMTGRDWAKHLGIGLNTINKYIRKYGYENTICFIRWALSNPQELLMNKNYYQNYLSNI